MTRFLAAIFCAVLLGTAILVGAFTLPVGSKSDMAGPTVLLTVIGGTGSGVVLPGGYILTAAHVAGVSPGAIQVTNDKGESTTEIDALWISREYDLALLKIRDEAFAASMQSADIECVTPPVGTDIRAEGNPFAVRFVSQWGKIGSGIQTIGPWKHAISIGAPLAPGMSGGPVFNLDGEVVGINVGIGPLGGFYIAVPASTACMLMGRA